MEREQQEASSRRTSGGFLEGVLRRKSISSGANPFVGGSTAAKKQVHLSFNEPAECLKSQQQQPSVSSAGAPTSNHQRQHHQVLVRYPSSRMASSPRMMAPRLSLLGKPIYLSSHKSYYRNTASMRWKMRLRNFLEQPQGFLPWLYHFSL